VPALCWPVGGGGGCWSLGEEEEGEEEAGDL